MKQTQQPAAPSAHVETANEPTQRESLDKVWMTPTLNTVGKVNRLVAISPSTPQ